MIKRLWYYFCSNITWFDVILLIIYNVHPSIESRELIDILSSLGFADDYREVQRLYSAMLPTDEPDYDLVGHLVNFVYDNADINIRTLTGHGIWHAMGGTAAITRGGQYILAHKLL